jgi:hypothetical protein
MTISDKMYRVYRSLNGVRLVTPECTEQKFETLRDAYFSVLAPTVREPGERKHLHRIVTEHEITPELAEPDLIAVWSSERRR